ncbi:MAG: hypothetical protein M0R70_05725 [Nitrospirae bacterium]|nr:hypothetical protein [Nitrospirota bacterium]
MTAQKNEEHNPTESSETKDRKPSPTIGEGGKSRDDLKAVWMKSVEDAILARKKLPDGVFEQYERFKTEEEIAKKAVPSGEGKLQKTADEAAATLKDLNAKMVERGVTEARQGKSDADLNAIWMKSVADAIAAGKTIRPDILKQYEGFRAEEMKAKRAVPGGEEKLQKADDEATATLKDFIDKTPKDVQRPANAGSTQAGPERNSEEHPGSIRSERGRSEKQDIEQQKPESGLLRASAGIPPGKEGESGQRLESAHVVYGGLTMNRKQQSILFIMALLIGIQILYPPYVSSPYKVRYDSSFGFGYSFIFDLPHDSGYSTTINTTALLVPICGVLLVGSLLYLALKSK